MICYIDSVLSSRLIYVKEDPEEVLMNTLKEYSISYKVNNSVEDYVSVDIQPQKIVLDEFQMNIFFKEVIEEYIPLVEICWTNMGHEDFCIKLQKEDIYE